MFAHANWSGKNHSEALPENRSRQLDINFTVKEFFQCFSWQRQQKIPVKQTNNIPRKSEQTKNQSTLSELSQLF